MDPNQFKDFAKATIDYLANYFDTIRTQNVVSSIAPGYLQSLLPSETPVNGESWQTIFQDIDKIIVPGLTHWHSPYFYAYYPTANSYSGIVGELLTSGFGVISTDNSSSVCDDLELVMMNWLAKILGLPKHFLNLASGVGGGFIQNSASDSTLLALLSGKQQKLTETQKISTLIAYTSQQANSSVEKAGLLASIPIRLLPTDENGSLCGSTLLQQIQQDIALNIQPCCVIVTLGTTGTCAFDKLDEIGPICANYKIWLHVDAAYAGSVFSCPEYRYLLNGIEFVDSFNFNPHKWMLVNSDCSAMWFRNTTKLQFIDNGKKHEGLHHLQLSSSRRFRALKLWIVLKITGVQGIQKHIRFQIYLANLFKSLVEKDERFIICVCIMGLVCFQLKTGNKRTQQLLKKIEKRRKIFIMPYNYKNKLMIRFVVCSRFTEEKDIVFAWNEIVEQANLLL